MIQNIFPSVLDNSFHYGREPDGGDIALMFNGANVYAKDGAEISFPSFDILKNTVSGSVPLLSVDGHFIYGVRSDPSLLPEGFKAMPVAALMGRRPSGTCFAAVTAYHLFGWYRDNTFCGRCGSVMKQGTAERSLVCSDCGNIVYPRIAPGIIVGVTHGDKILLTKYAGRDYTQYALIAGFCEIGETPEDTVRREVMEETGVRVKNIHYCASQPWAMSESLLMGFYAELDGSPEITVDRSELSEAGWFSRNELDLKPDNISLTRYMITRFLKNEM